MAGSSAEARMVNRHLDDVRTKIYEIYNRTLRKEKPISAQIIRDIYRGKNKEHKMLLNLFKEHSDKIESLISKGNSSGTLQCYNSARTHLEHYLQFTKKRADIPLGEIDYEFISGFEKVSSKVLALYNQTIFITILINSVKPARNFLEINT